MSKTIRYTKDEVDGNRRHHTGKRAKQRRISVRAVRRQPPDLRKLSRAVIQLAMAEAAAEAEAAAQTNSRQGEQPDEPASVKEQPDGD